MSLEECQVTPMLMVVDCDGVPLDFVWCRPLGFHQSWIERPGQCGQQVAVKGPAKPQIHWWALKLVLWRNVAYLRGPSARCGWSWVLWPWRPPCEHAFARCGEVR